MQTFVEFGRKNIRNIKLEAGYEGHFQMRKVLIIRFRHIIDQWLTSDDAVMLRVLIKKWMQTFIEFGRKNIRIMKLEAAPSRDYM